MSILHSFYDSFHKHGSVQYRPISKNNFTYRNVIRSFLESISSQDGLKVLDYGCGVGTLALYVANLGNKVVGIDISTKAINLARKNSLQMDLTKNTNFFTLESWNKLKNSEKFDLAFAIEVIEHVPDDLKLLKSINLSLRKNGILILSTPSQNAPLFRLGLARDFDKSVGHLRRYSIEGLISKIEKSGFKVQKVEKNEGIIRNSLYLFPLLGFSIRFIRGPISDFVSYIDNITIKLFGESNIYIVAIKK
jgi:SAM-dependent methyltransferase